MSHPFRLLRPVFSPVCLSETRRVCLHSHAMLRAVLKTLSRIYPDHESQEDFHIWMKGGTGGLISHLGGRVGGVGVASVE